LHNKHSIDIWKANLDISPQLEKSYWALLNVEEKQRANRLIKPEHKRYFIAGRGILRSLLGTDLNLTPESINFDYLPRGKPILAKHHQTALQFNISHSKNLALYAFSNSQTVGIDLEFIHPLPSALSLAERFFTPQEAEYLSFLSPDDQEKMFFRFWTAKEAYLKATGEGIAGLEKIEVMVSDRDQNQFEIIHSEQAMSLYTFTPEDNFIATIASLRTENLNQDPQSDRAPDTSNKSKVADRYSFSESLNHWLVFHNWDE
jgi:4'-phosphopantetheinyl transferase